MPKWWLISWTTYATWLSGDPRGYCTWRGEQYVAPPKRYAKPGEPIYNPAEHTWVYELAQSSAENAVYLTRDEMETALGAMIEEIAELPIVPAIISLGPRHLHWLCSFGELKIRPTTGRIKAAATRELNRCGFQGKRPWTKGCNIKSKSTRLECRNAYKYILDHVNQGCLIYKWTIDPNTFVLIERRRHAVGLG